ncbi:MAG TPA: FAD-dependent oxidoreductase [Candidatus Binataceae bacterium]|nr:FAD-dependent oxidoreductase [Candidatus Binataceae bacterium]
MAEQLRRWGEQPWRAESFAVRPFKAEPADVIVVGGGLTGAAAALRLARAGLRTVLLEAGRFGDAASGRTGGIVLEGTAWGPREGANRCVPDLEKLVRDESIDCDLEVAGCWEIDHRKGSDQLPWLDGETPIRIARIVAGGVVNPLALLAGLANRAAESGAMLHEHARVTRVLTDSSPAVEAAGVTLRTRHLVIAANAWTSALVPAIRPTRAALTFAIATAPLDTPTLAAIGLNPGLPFYTIDLPYLWGRLTRERRLIMGAGLLWGSADELEALDVCQGEAAAILERLETRVRRLNPALRDVRVEYRWAGPIAIPDGQAPQIGRLAGAPDIFVASGYAGHGVALSVTAGTLLARAIIEAAPLPRWAEPAKSGGKG